MTALDIAREYDNTECAELLIAVIEPRFQSVFNSTAIYPAVQLSSLCAGRSTKRPVPCRTN